FEIANYDKSRPLIIDPVLSYSTYFGGSDADFLGVGAVDSEGNVLLGGAACIFGTTTNQCDGSVIKINSTGTAVIFSTVLAGSKHCESAGIPALDANGNVFLPGTTCSTD